MINIYQSRMCLEIYFKSLLLQEETILIWWFIKQECEGSLYFVYQCVTLKVFQYTSNQRFTHSKNWSQSLFIVFRVFSDLQGNLHQICSELMRAFPKSVKSTASATFCSVMDLHDQLTFNLKCLYTNLFRSLICYKTIIVEQHDIS